MTAISKCKKETKANAKTVKTDYSFVQKSNASGVELKEIHFLHIMVTIRDTAAPKNLIVDYVNQFYVAELGIIS